MYTLSYYSGSIGPGYYALRPVLLLQTRLRASAVKRANRINKPGGRCIFFSPKWILFSLFSFDFYHYYFIIHFQHCQSSLDSLE